MVMLLNIFSGTYNVILRGTPWYFETKMKVIRNTPNACRLISIFVWCHFLCSIVLSLMLYSSCKQLARIYLMRASFVVRQGRINYCTSLSKVTVQVIHSIPFAHAWYKLWYTQVLCYESIFSFSEIHHIYLFFFFIENNIFQRIYFLKKDTFWFIKRILGWKKIRIFFLVWQCFKVSHSSHFADMIIFFLK